MKAFLLLADAARAHPDGTFSVLRGGIDRIHSPETRAIRCKASIVARIRGTMEEAGTHQFKLRFINEDGKPIIDDLTGQFTIPDTGGGTQMCLDLDLILPKFGRYMLALTVDGQEVDSWELRAEQVPEPGVGPTLPRPEQAS